MLFILPATYNLSFSSSNSFEKLFIDMLDQVLLYLKDAELSAALFWEVYVTSLHWMTTFHL